MKIVCISDTHTYQPTIPECDLLIHAGDMTFDGSEEQVSKQLAWIASAPATRKVVVPGNHDWFFQRDVPTAERMCELNGIDLLVDELMSFERKLIYGMPWQPWFHDWAFNLERDGDEMANVVDKIPTNVDILVTHGPPMHVLDRARGQGVGCRLLRDKLRFSMDPACPRLHVFGHIHEGYGVTRDPEIPSTIFVNASICTPGYRPTNPPVTIHL